MNELIEIKERQIGPMAVSSVDARALHKFLEVGRDFSTWITDRLKEYGFAPNRDYAVITKSGENSKGGRRRSEYFLTIDTAKELAMVERTDRGREVRQYFIEAEKRLREKSNVTWIEARSHGKVVRKVTTDVIALFIEYAKGQGSSNADMYFLNFSKMVNSALIEIEGKKPANFRDQLNALQLAQVSVAEGIITKSIMRCIGAKKPYKDIYQIAKGNIQQYADSVGRTKLGQSERQAMGLLA